MENSQRLIAVIQYQRNVSYKYAEVINIERACFIILHLFMCKEISLKSCLQINESSFRVRVIP